MSDYGSDNDSFDLHGEEYVRAGASIRRDLGVSPMTRFPMPETPTPRTEAMMENATKQLASVPDPLAQPTLEVTVTLRFAAEVDDALMYWIVEKDRAAGRFVLMDCPEHTAREALGSIHEECFFSVKGVPDAH